MSDAQREEIARLIKEGYTSGRLDDEQEDGSCEYVAWELTSNIWTDP